MKHLLLFILLLVPSLAQAQTLVSKESANKYFANCVAQPATGQLSADGQNILCACTAARLTQFFTIEDMQKMGNADPAIARPAYNKMMTDIYAPCMSEPTRERYYARCAKATGANQRVCTCAADKIAVHMKNYGSQIFGNILAQNASVEDPWAALENSPDFNNFIDTATQSCLK